jgi:isopentenyl-diphosphate delta-isomerase
VKRLAIIIKHQRMIKNQRRKVKTSLSSSVVLVNESDQELGQAPIIETHRQPGQLHRACSVFIFQQPSSYQDSQRQETIQLLLQKRSAEKLTAPSTWANTVCGHVRPRESYLACAQRRLREEIGLVDIELKPIMKFTYQVKLDNNYVEKELDQVYCGFWSGPISLLKLNSQEVDQVQLIKWSELLDKVEADQLIGLKLSPWFRYFLQYQPLVDNINQSL